MSEALHVAHPGNDPDRTHADEAPLRSELFSSEQLEEHARRLAEWHRLDTRAVRDRLLTRLAENEIVLRNAHALVGEALAKGQQITPAAEWLLDNFYLIEEQIRLARRHLPARYSRELPRLMTGPTAGVPRVYDIALELISHVDGQVDVENLGGFVSAYQSKAILTLGELWAIPIMLRLASIENLRRVAARIAAGRQDRARADYWAERLIDMAEREPRHVVLVLADMVREQPPLTNPFVAELTRRCHGRGPALASSLAWVEERLVEAGMTIEEIVQQVSQSQAADQVSIGNSIGSLRFIAATDWRDFVESMSAVERMLRGDPTDTYRSMDFVTRNDYRRAVERIARRSRRAEHAVAQAALDLAFGQQNTEDVRRRHVGYYLVGDGLPELERAVGSGPSLSAALDRVAMRYPLGLYLGGTLLLTAMVSGFFSSRVVASDVRGAGLVVLVLAAVVVASQLATAVVQWWTSLVVPPHRIPRMDFAHGIPEELRTLVVVPTLLTTKEAVGELLDALEVRYLANRDPNLAFALLTDFCDAHHETSPTDDEILDTAVEGIEQLNERYKNGAPFWPFFLLHRRRRFNRREACWMGHERKRGKLTDLNARLRGRGDQRFDEEVGATDLLESVRYVITLDTDTDLPRDAAKELVATLAHPLNRARYDERLGRVVEGYGVLQPRVAVSLPSARRSQFARLFAADVGIDPYTRAVSDVYQDAFGEGSYIGKGIYDVDAFEDAIGDSFPENRILSHDLLEGGYVRAGLVSDIVLPEEHPSSYLVDVARRERWIRGDWQIASWLLPRVPKAHGTGRNPLSPLSRWKVFDNLRRSLFAPSALVLLVVGWLLGAGYLATTFLLATFFVPPILLTSAELARRPTELPIFVHLKNALRSAFYSVGQALLALVCLPHEAYVASAAIVRTLVRLVTRRHLLEWESHGAFERRSRTHLGGFYRSMWVAPATAVLLLSATRGADAFVAFLVVPVALTWMVSPAIAWWVSRRTVFEGIRIRPEDRVFLGTIARRTWAWFETFVSAADHHLPPDNYQEHPVERLAHRTSPTNIGLSLLANLSAHDLGYVGTRRLVERTTATFASMDKLERYRGHFLNWYDTTTLQPLGPHYVSTVDSGNLVGSLIVLSGGLHEVGRQPLLRTQCFQGLGDALEVVAEELGAAFSGGTHDGVDAIRVRLSRLRASLASPAVTLVHGQQLLRRLARMTADLQEDLDIGLAKADGETSESNARIRFWVRSLERQCDELLAEVLYFAPWISLLPPDAVATRRPQDDAIGRLEARLLLLDDPPTLRDLALLDSALAPAVEEAFASLAGTRTELEDRAWLEGLSHMLGQASVRAAEALQALETLATRAKELADDPTYDFLYDPNRRLMTIGYNATDRRRDGSFYDLLASEARVASFIAIAQGKLPQEHWFALGRLVTVAEGNVALLSWSGSMFEYLMPQLLMPTLPETLLGQTCRTVIRWQIAYAKDLDLPWGISESGYSATDVNLDYQYRAFGVPGLGFMRGLGDDRVIAPYASVMALPTFFEDACDNLRALARYQMVGTYGFYEALDFTPARLGRGQDHVIVRSYMAHHHGMSLVALTNVLCGDPMPRRFALDPEMRATELLLHERVPKVAPIYAHPAEVSGTWREPTEQVETVRTYDTPHTPTPEVHLLSNGRLHVMTTAAGGGYVRWRDLAVTRWHEDTTADAWGPFCYVRDVATERFWSTTHQPTLVRPRSYEAAFSEGRADFRRNDQDIATHLEIGVSPEDDVEVRRIRLTNRGRVRRMLELTTYAEVVLAPPSADAVHPVFGNLFVETEIVAVHGAILCTRRPRSQSERPPWMIHLVTVHTSPEAEPVHDVGSYETSRAEFIGRNGTLADPAAMHVRQLTNHEGAVLDPIVAIRRTFSLRSDEWAMVDIVTGVAETREQALSLLERYKSKRLVDRVFDLSWTHSQVTLRQLEATEADAQLYGRMASAILYANPSRRAAASVLARNRRGQSGLWGHGISGDLPIVLVRASDPYKLGIVRELVRAHAYWRMKGLQVDLVIWNEDQAGYRQGLHDQIVGMVTSGPEPHALDRPGGIFVRRGDQIGTDDKTLFLAVARLQLSDTEGTLSEQLDRKGRTEVAVPRLVSSGRPFLVPAVAPSSDKRRPKNGLGEFSRDGTEYVIQLEGTTTTPAPWSNVIANAAIGTVVTESGGAYTWVENAHELRLTPWYNDPVRDPSGEVFYVRDDESGQFWSPTPSPVRTGRATTVRHGFGYTVFETEEAGVASELTTFVAAEAPVKITLLRIRNRSVRTRRLSVFGMVEWVLGEQRSRTALHVTTEVDSRTGAMFARNPMSPEFPGHVAFFDVSEQVRSVTGNRGEFLGRNQTLEKPRAMGRARLSNRVGAGLDPCGAVQALFEVAPGAEAEIAFVLGAGKDVDEARQLVNRFRGVRAAKDALDEAKARWRRLLGRVQFETPDPSVDVLLNGWALYQTLSSRFDGRSGYYQSGGAYGFRDQLQDVLALLHADPSIARRHLLRCASRQFKEGDVQHWWHPPQGRGVRTRISDDYLWLPYAAAEYVTVTGDTGVLDEQVPFLEGRLLQPEEESYYDLPLRSEERGSLYEHCVRAIRHGLRFGERGLPLMGSGDWNDGMNLVGIEGRGESVWLAFFLYDVLGRFTPLAAARNDEALVQLAEETRASLHAAIETHAWDGGWYQRATTDAGVVIGTASAEQCRIDSLAQSWAVLSGAADPERARIAMEAVDRLLVRRDAGLILVLDPPFDHSALNPGYIQGYVPGVRENGGQYTHAAIWTIMAFAKLGDHARAWELLALTNPVGKGATPEGVARYRVEPYVLAADVYGNAQHLGRGGWSWYTGSAGWWFRLVTESMLGLRREVDHLFLEPVIPPEWKSFRVHYRHRETAHHITVVNGPGRAVKRVVVDGQERPGPGIELLEDGQDHEIRVELG